MNKRWKLNQRAVQEWQESRRELKGLVLAMIVSVIFWLSLAVFFINLLGCSSQTGWRISFGVSPVTAIEEKQALDKKDNNSRQGIVR